jgi:integrase/recombinase XerD
VTDNWRCFVLNIMVNTVARPGAWSGGRKYVSLGERMRFIERIQAAPAEHRLFMETLAWTGARVTEVLMLTPISFDLHDCSVTLPTLKRRKPIFRVLYLPPTLIGEIVGAYAIAEAMKSPAGREKRLWRFNRTTAWRMVKSAMLAEGIAGVRGSPRGLRHGFGVSALQSGVPVTLLKRWMGHARLTTTEIYTDVAGPEELEFARLFWKRGMPKESGPAAQD